MPKERPKYRRLIDRSQIERGQKSISPDLHALVKQEIGRFIGTVRHAYIDKDEVEAWAWLGFLEAKKRFDPRKGTEFSAFARQRVRGSIYDGLSAIHPLGQKGTRIVKRVLKGIDLERFDQVSSESPNDAKDELHAAESVQETNTFHDCYKQIYFQALMVWSETLADRFVINSPELTSEAVDQITAKNLLSMAFDQLDETEQELMIAIYDLRRIGDHASAYASRKGVHRSTISRKHTQVLKKLKRLVSAATHDCDQESQEEQGK